ncbi:hypothetical protein [Mycobacterium intracellulare]|uniref:hypothetical protein n=1 Tax=Mycobacterium intracellulare TaxID=1767 RepID=UPI0006CA6213|nr:hypothetical protein [Mycobacterium intracellulare]KPN46864.1 hypothetical protein AN933_25405 [Mycobacterium intracellulare subsp. chimaera]
MSYNRIAILAALRTELVDGGCNPSRGLAELAGRLLGDDSFDKTMLHKIAEHRPLAAALLWTRIADQLGGQPRIEALALAAVFAFNAGNPGLTAGLIDRVDVAARRDHTEFPAMLRILKLDHRVRAHLAAV